MEVLMSMEIRSLNYENLQICVLTMRCVDEHKNYK
jgi:hypothetical protein